MAFAVARDEQDSVRMLGLTGTHEAQSKLLQGRRYTHTYIYICICIWKGGYIGD